MANTATQLGATPPACGNLQPRLRSSFGRTATRFRRHPVPRSRTIVGGKKSLVDTAATIIEGMREIFNYESWAPRGARAYRLREVPGDVSVKAEQEAAEREALQLEAMLNGTQVVAEGEEGYEALQTVSRLRQTIEAAQQSMEEGEDVLTGERLAEMCFSKYSRYHDMSIKHVTMNKGKTARWVALNVYVGYLGQKTFPYNQEEYIEKLDSIATMLNAWNQIDYVTAFFDEPPIPRRGLPSRPRVDTAVSLRLNKSPTWDDALADEFFSY